MIRRLFTLVFCIAAFWAGMTWQQVQYTGACGDAGGTMRGDLCTGAQP